MILRLNKAVYLFNIKLVAVAGGMLSEKVNYKYRRYSSEIKKNSLLEME
jgi:hypothetical protein